MKALLSLRGAYLFFAVLEGGLLERGNLCEGLCEGAYARGLIKLSETRHVKNSFSKLLCFQKIIGTV